MTNATLERTTSTRGMTITTSTKLTKITKSSRDLLQLIQAFVICASRAIGRPGGIWMDHA
jgi:hypothetical protein